jgi:hypothetical protein
MNNLDGTLARNTHKYILVINNLEKFYLIRFTYIVQWWKNNKADSWFNYNHLYLYSHKNYRIHTDEQQQIWI